jgi:hypothetical protein
MGGPGNWRLTYYRFDWPRDAFLIFFFIEPRGVVRLALGAAFLRAARFTFFRSSLSSSFLVFATGKPLSLECLHGRPQNGQTQNLS